MPQLAQEIHSHVHSLWTRRMTRRMPGRPAWSFPTPTSRPLSILLAEDHAELRELLARELEADGVLVDCVGDGYAAQDRILKARFRPDAVVSDIRMPGRDGIDLLRGIRGAGLTIPVILFTGFAQSASHREVERFGGAVLLAKPFDFDDLRTALRNLPAIARLRPTASGLAKTK